MLNLAPSSAVKTVWNVYSRSHIIMLDCLVS